ncbi:heavy-metal-associated domain-containing protein [Nesterenkonia sphaerica]|uniref:heavy-metal-associated domain-containing protein n=1 Tax=Nesterenkonia sphaerica TaxID=1804988 RepID=UPI001AA069DE|nr:heavy-metal-associated domain-containing protein [Nesterenkonia sphaerica]
MNAPARLGVYGLILAAVFTVAGLTASVVVPEETVQSWIEEAPEDQHGAAANDAQRHDGPSQTPDLDASSMGLASAQEGYQLSITSAPAEQGTLGELSLVVTGTEGDPVTDFELSHEQELHLIVVRADGEHFRHVHPDRNTDGVWTIPWEWPAGGSYRLYADFVPADTGEAVTLSSTVQVAGDYTPAPAAEPVTETTVEGFRVSVEGELLAGKTSELTLTVTRGDEPVTDLEPYLGALGHLVALREGDLAYLHVHPHRDTAHPDETAGPEITFEVTAPTVSHYLLYLDFQVDGEVHTAALALTATAADEDAAQQNPDQEAEDDDH